MIRQVESDLPREIRARLASQTARLLPCHICDVKKGDVVHFKAYALRVEEEPQHGRGTVHLTGRTNQDGCPRVTKQFNASQAVEVVRQPC